MPRQWKTWDDWSGGGFFAGGSFNQPERYNSLNMQRYQNGSIGPRPGWRKMTQVGSIPTFTTAKKNNAKLGLSWTSSNYTSNPDSITPTLGTFIFVGAVDADSTGRRIIPRTNGECRFYTGPTYKIPTAVSVTPEVYSLNVARLLKDIVQNIEVLGPTEYTINSGLTTNPTPRTISAVNYYPRHIVFYRGRAYGWKSLSPALGESIRVLVSSTSSSLDFNGGDSGDFTVAGSSNTGEVIGMWPLASGLLIYSYSGLRSSYTDYNTGVAGNRGTEIGQWYTLTGPNPSTGVLTPLEQETGPLWYPLSVVHDGKVLFPIYQRGWAIHDGQSLDKASLAELRPGRGAYATGSLWLNPVRTLIRQSLILPFYTSGVDPTSETKDNGAVVGEFYNTGYGAYEFVNGAWCEQQYLHGQGDIGPGISSFEGDKLVMSHLDSSDGGTTWFPQIYCRETTLDRPSTVGTLEPYNSFSDGNETAPTQSGGATGMMYHMLETGEHSLGNAATLRAEAVVLDYDYWNSSLFDSDCGFDVYVTYRSVADNEKVTVKINTARITPPGISLEHYPKRGRAVLNLPHRNSAGSVQVKLDNIIGVAVRSISLAYEAEEQIR